MLSWGSPLEHSIDPEVRLTKLAGSLIPTPLESVIRHLTGIVRPAFAVLTIGRLSTGLKKPVNT